MKKHLLTLLLATAALPAAAFAHDYTLGALNIHHPWTRATPPAATNAAGYVTITNTGTTADTLTAASMDGAGMVMLHQTGRSKDMVTMKAVDGGIAIPAGATVELKPESFHIMAMQLAHPYAEGQSISGTLTFAKAGILPVSFKVEAMGAQAPVGEAAPMPMDMNMHHMHGM